MYHLFLLLEVAIAAKILLGAAFFVIFPHFIRAYHHGEARLASEKRHWRRMGNLKNRELYMRMARYFFKAKPHGYQPLSEDREMVGTTEYEFEQYIAGMYYEPQYFQNMARLVTPRYFFGRHLNPVSDRQIWNYHVATYGLNEIRDDKANRYGWHLKDLRATRTNGRGQTIREGSGYNELRLKEMMGENNFELLRAAKLAYEKERAEHTAPMATQDAMNHTQEWDNLRYANPLPGIERPDGYEPDFGDDDTEDDTLELGQLPRPTPEPRERELQPSNARQLEFSPIVIPSLQKGVG